MILGFRSQGLALEVNPWQTKESVEAVLLYRGAIISGWANVETSLIEVAIRASLHDAYLGHRDSYPSRFDGRISYLRAVLDLPGPLNNYSRLGHSILDRFTDAVDVRNIMAHARMSLLPMWGATFHIFQPKSDIEINYRALRFSEEQLKMLAEKATRLSRVVRMLIAQIDARALLPPLAESE
jgi:hypothetical protein